MVMKFLSMLWKFPSHDEAALRELDAKAMLDLRRTQPAKRKILRLTGLFLQNGSKFHFGNDDNDNDKGNGFFPRDHSQTFHVSPGMGWSGMPGTMYEKGMSILVSTPFSIRLLWYLGVLQRFKVLAVTEARLLLLCSL